MSSPQFRTEFDPRHGEAVELAPGIRRIVCDNGGPFTFHGTNTYLIGEGSLAVLDPGPVDDNHFQAILAAVGSASVSHILVSHTHMDHSPLAERLQQETGAATFAFGPHRAARDLHLGELNPLDASADTSFVPDHALRHGEQIEGEDWQLTALHTPGHTANHMAFAMDGTDYLFSADQVMGWATSIVAPPDGNMRDYMASLDILLDQPQQTYFPGHGGRIDQAQKFVRALRAHRKMREQAVLDQVRKGRQTIPDMVAVIYRSTDPRLHGAAGLSVLAHLEDLVRCGKVTADGDVLLDSRYFPV